MQLSNKLINLILQCLFKTYFKLQVSNQHYLPEQPFILVSNHASHMDSVALSLATGKPLHNFCFLAAKDYYFSNKNLFKMVVRKFINLIPFDRQCTKRSNAFANNLAMCATCLEQNKNLVIYPEATRSADGKIKSFKSGASIIATEFNTLIVPAYIAGCYKLLPKVRCLPKPGKVAVIFGKPLDVKTYINIYQNNDLYRAITKDLEKTVIQLQQEFEQCQ